MARTAKPTHGERGWNALQGLPNNVAQCIALYHNSIFGATVRNAYGQSTQAGRATIQVGAIPDMPCPAFGTDTPEAQAAREIAKKNFDKMARLKLEPFAYCYRDKNRHIIDNVVAEMLGLNPDDEEIQRMLDHYRIMFASEPSVNGRQKKIVDAQEKHLADENEGVDLQI